MRRCHLRPPPPRPQHCRAGPMGPSPALWHKDHTVSVRVGRTDRGERIGSLRGPCVSRPSLHKRNVEMKSKSRPASYLETVSENKVKESRFAKSLLTDGAGEITCWWQYGQKSCSQVLQRRPRRRIHAPRSNFFPQSSLAAFQGAKWMSENGSIKKYTSTRK